MKRLAAIDGDFQTRRQKLPRPEGFFAVLPSPCSGNDYHPPYDPLEYSVAGAFVSELPHIPLASSLADSDPHAHLSSGAAKGAFSVASLLGIAPLSIVMTQGPLADTCPVPSGQLSPCTPRELPQIMVPSPKSDSGMTSPSCSAVCAGKGLAALLAKECDTLPGPDYVKRQKPKALLRKDIIHWLKSIAAKLGYVPETFYMAINFYDRYLSKVNVTQSRQYRLLALTCLYVAGKLLEELAEPLMKEMVSFSDKMFTPKEILRMERKIVYALDWNLSCVTPFCLVDEVFLSLGYPDCRDVGKHSKENRARTALEKKLNPLIGPILLNLDLCTLKPSTILRACLDFLDLTKELHPLGLDSHMVASLLPAEKVPWRCLL
ncbi:hypothetical protein HDU91_001159 [Kappamyces sp. JEL0680]|nr:hypothetical protein HDU91_001159 [Kappamyces sp. JEL0680]